MSHKRSRLTANIPLSLLTAIIISFSILSVTLFLYHYELEDEKWVPKSDTLEGKEIAFYSQHFSDNQKKIFLIGSSEIWSLDPNYIRESLQKNNLDYTVYNLGIATDVPKSRVKTIDWIISAKPTMIIYGISDRDFSIAGSTTLDENQINILPNPHDVIMDWLNIQLTNYQNVFYFLQSPKLDFLTLVFGSSYTGMNKGFSPDPVRYTASFEEIALPIANDIALQTESEHSGSPKILPLDENENFVSFEEMIGKLRKNNILVIILIVPQERHRLEKLNDVVPFNFVLKSISKEHPDVQIYSLWDNYADLHIWKDNRHVVKDTRTTSRIYNDDVTTIIDTYLLPKEKEATTFGWNEDKGLAVLTPPRKVPAYTQSLLSTSFPVSDRILLSIWKERKDLQKAYPEVAEGNLTKLQHWAVTSGWNEDKRLAALIPWGEIPKYLGDTLVAIWKERKDLQKVYPEVAGGNLTAMKKWASTSGWNEDKRLVALIPSGKVPAYLQKPFPVSDTILTTIWEERKDLQKVYPEVAGGNLTAMKKWASTSGWNEDKRLSALIPPGKVPKYLEK
ncbi:MAG: hypothetical protein AUH25_03320 [Thaumarchaeota archaeon 13_1_40CM_38_12]|nr:MAG: hypothetical protein AUH25_03320 [Thaumarchaeota archaeon 13_1_40CM_38_12]